MKLRWLLFGVGGLLLALLFLLFLAVVFLQTAAGKGFLARQMESLLSSGAERQVVLEKLDGFIPFEIRLDRLEISDREGSWLKGEDLSLRWSPLALLFRKVHVYELSASSIHVDRSPLSSEEEPPAHFSLPRLPSIVVEKVQISALEFGKSLLGSAAVFSIRGGASQETESAGLTVSLLIQRTDPGPETTAEVVAVMSGTQPELDLKAVLREAPGGWLARVMSIPHAGKLQLDLEGKAPLETWKGDLRARAEYLGLLEADIGVEVGDAVLFELDGHMETAASLVSPKWISIFTPRVSLGIALRLEPSVGLSLDRMAVAAPGFNLKASGDFRYEGEKLQGALDLNIPDAALLGVPESGPAQGRIALRAGVTGTAEEPEADVSLTAEDFAMEDMRVDGMQTAFHIAGSPGTSETGRVFHISGKGSAEGISNLAGKKQPAMSFRWAGEAEVIEKGKTTVRTLTVDGFDTHLELEGWLDPETMKASVSSRLEMKDLKSIAALTGGDYSGQGLIELQLDSTEGVAGAAGTVRGELRGLGGLPAQVKSLTGEHVKLTGELALKERSVFAVPSMHIQGSGFSMGLDGFFNQADNLIHANMTMLLPDLRVLSESAGRPLAGNVETRVRVKGSTDAAECTATVEGSNISIGGERFQRIHGLVKAENIPSSPRGVFSLDVLKGEEKGSVAAEYLLEGDRFHLKGLKIDGPGVSLEGGGDYRLSRPMVRGNLDGQFKDFAALGRFVGRKLKGSGRLQGRFTEVDQKQQVSLRVSGNEIGGSFGDVGKFSLSADLGNVMGTPEGKADLSVANFSREGLSVNSLSLRSSADGKSITFATSARGTAGDPYDLKAEGLISRTREDDRLNLSMLQGRFGKYPFRLKSPWAVTRKAERIEVGSLELSFGEASVQAGGRLDGRRVNITGTVTDLPLEMLARFGLPTDTGEADMSFQVAGDVSRPNAVLKARVNGVRASDSDLKHLPPVAVSADAEVEGDRLSVGAQIEGITQKPARGDLSLPVKLSLQPLDFSINPNGVMKGRAEAEGDLQSLIAYFPQEEHKLRGAFHVDIEAKGTLASPDISGQVTVDNGHYENWEHGTVLGNISSRVVGRGKRIEIEEFRATDGGKGRVEAKGWLEMEQVRNFPFDLSIMVTDAGLVRKDNLTAEVGGTLQLSGSLNGISLKGDLTTGPMEVNVAKRPPPAVTKLEVVEINKKGDVQADRTERKTTGGGGVKVDVSVKIPRRLFVRGGGLDSEWNGKLKVEGTERTPVVIGNLASVRGHFDFLDKRFKIVKGIIQFHGVHPPAPTLDIVAEAQGKDVLARLRILGTAESPEIKLESEPQLPQDEILSNLLFGRKVSDINPVQAIRLARAVRSLSGGGGGPGIVDRTRRLLGLDQLGFREGQSKESKGAVGIGKYLTDEIYLDVQKDISGQAGKATVQVEITPHISVEGQAGSDASTGLGINWKHDY